MAEKSKPHLDLRIAVVVVGMHRSGTSALAGVLMRLGCEGPKDLIPAAPMNTKGFFESETISHFNEELMTSAGSSWYSWQPFNADWFRSTRADGFRSQALTHLSEIYADARMPMLKDPRISLLVPFWDEVLKGAGYAPRYVHTHRHPLEVAQSLSHWAGYDPSYGQLLWLRYMLDAEVGTRGERRVFTSYPALMTDWMHETSRISEALDIAWPSNSDRITAQIDEFLDADLKHMNAKGSKRIAGLRMSPWVAETLEIFNAWAEHGENLEDHARLDSLRQRLDEATITFSASIEAGRRDSLMLQTKAGEEKATLGRLEKLQAAQDELRQTAKAEAKALSTALEQAERQHAEVEAALQAKVAEDDQVRQAAEAAQAEAKALSTALEQAERQHAEVEAALQSSVSNSEVMIGDLRDRIAALESELAQRRAENDDVRRHWQEAGDEIGVLKISLEGARTERAKLEGEKAEMARSAAEQVEALKQELQEARDIHQTLAAEREIFMRDLRIARTRDERNRRNELSQLLSANREYTDRAIRAAEARAQEAVDKAELQTERLRAAEQYIDDLLTSTSWRLTGPFRKILIALRLR